MNINVETLPNCQAVVRVEVPGDTVSTIRGKIVQGFAKQAKIRGYRPGKVPTNVVEKRFKRQIEEELTERLIQNGLQEALQQEKLNVLRADKVEDQEFNEDGTFSFKGELTLRPEFDLPEYKGIPVTVKKPVVAEEDIDEVIEEMRGRLAEYNDVERAIQDNDFAILDYEAKIDGELMEEKLPSQLETYAKGKDQWVRVHMDGFLPGFTENLEGKTQGDKFEIEITIPEDFAIEDLREKAATYTVEVQGVKEQVLPEVNDDFAGKIMPGKDLGALRELFEEQLLRERESQCHNAKVDQIVQHLSGLVDFEIPEVLVQQETQSRVNQIVEQNRQRGVQDDELESNEKEIFGVARDQAHSNVKTSFILGKVADAEKIEAQEQEVMGYIQQVAQQNKTPIKKLIKEIQDNNSIESIRGNIRTSKVLDFLIQNANVEEVDEIPEEESSEA